MAKVAVVGGLSIDHLVEEELGARFAVPGGPGLYGSLGARLVGDTRVELIARIPVDGGLADHLHRLEVATTHAPTLGRAVRVWMLTDRHGRMVLPVKRPDEPELISGDRGVDEPGWDLPAALDVDGVLLSSPETIPQAWRPPVVGIDPHQWLVRSGGLDHFRSLEGATVFLPSRTHLLLLDPDPLRAIALVHEATGVAVVGRLDADGMVVLDADGLRRVTDPSAIARETTGAGDASAAAVVAALARGDDLDTAARFGASAARIAISDWGDAALSTASPMPQPFHDITIRKVRS